MLKKLLICLSVSLGSFGCQKLPSSSPAAISSPQLKANDRVTANVPFSPTYESDYEDNYPIANKIYASSPKASTGVYEYKDLIFVVIVIDTKKESVRYLEGTAMLRAVAYLRKEYPGLPAKFSANNRLMEKRFYQDTGIYRYALAYRKKTLLQQIPTSEYNEKQ